MPGMYTARRSTRPRRTLCWSTSKRSDVDDREARVTPALSDLAQEIVAPDEAEVTAECIAFLKDASRRRHPTGPIRRFNQGRAAGCVEATFEIPEHLPEALRVGLFARPGAYRAHIRFANASSTTDRDK